MTLSDSATRAELSFSVDGLTAREDLLFRALMRVVTQKTRQSWHYQPLAQSQLNRVRADLRVITEDKLPPEAMTASARPPMLVVGYIERRRPGFICLPINPQALASELNRLGTGLTSLRTQTVDGQQSHAKAAPDTGQTDHEWVRLLRWPPPHLLGSPQRIQLATLMAGQAVTAAVLQNRSKQPAQVCQDFMAALQKAGLLYRWTDSRPKPVSRASKPPQSLPSLITRIRNRLGLRTDGRH